MLLYRVTILASLMSYGTAPSLQHWQRTSCKGCSRVVLQCLIKSEGILSLPGALPAAKESMALLSVVHGRLRIELFHDWHAFDGVDGCWVHCVLSFRHFDISYLPSVMIWCLRLATFRPQISIKFTDLGLFFFYVIRWMAYCKGGDFVTHSLTHSATLVRFVTAG